MQKTVVTGGKRRLFSTVDRAEAFSDGLGLFWMIPGRCVASASGCRNATNDDSDLRFVVLEGSTFRATDHMMFSR